MSPGEYKLKRKLNLISEELSVDKGAQPVGSEKLPFPPHPSLASGAAVPNSNPRRARGAEGPGCT